MAQSTQLETLLVRLGDEQRALILQAAEAGMVPSAGALSRIAMCEKTAQAVEAVIDEQSVRLGGATFNHPATAALPQARQEHTMATGTVKWFNTTKGFGFIQPDQGGPDAFVHISAVERAGMRELLEGQKIAYELVPDRRTGKQSADQLKAVE